MSLPEVPMGSSTLKRVAPSDSDDSKTCETCGNVFSKRCHLLRHLRTHETPQVASQGEPDPRTACFKCSKVFSRTDALKRHMRTKHAGDPSNVPARCSNTQENSVSEAADSHGGVSQILQNLGTASNMNAGAFASVPSQDLDDGCTMSNISVFASSERPGHVTNLTENHASSKTIADTSGAEQWQDNMQALQNEVTFPTSHELSPFSGFQAYFKDFVDFPTEQTILSISHTDSRLASNQVASAWDSLTLWQVPGFPSNEPTNQALYQDPSPTLGETWETQIQALNGLFNTVSRPASPVNVTGSQTALSLVRGAPNSSSNLDSRALGSRTSHTSQSASLPGTSSLFQHPARNAEGPTLHSRLTADTWQADIREDDTTEAAHEASQIITSPEDVVHELRVVTEQVEDRSLIPSLSFLDSCIYLYFKFFHVQFPILHRPTFDRDKAPKFLLLSICSIGCMFMGTPEARKRGLQIYEQLHHAIINTRDSRMAVERTRVAVVMAALLGQSYSFLSGQAKHLYTGEGFHGWLCTCARRAGLLRLANMPSPTFSEIRNLDDDRLERAWRQWAHLQTLRRACHGLIIHAAEATAYSAVARILPARIGSDEENQDILFEAQTSKEWYRLLQLQESQTAAKHIVNPLFHFALGCQQLVDVHAFQELQASGTAFYAAGYTTKQYYAHLKMLAGRMSISPGETFYDRLAPKQRVLHVLWHYSCISWLSQIDIINEVAGRVGNPRPQAVRQIKEWVVTALARLAVLHSAHILLASVELRDQAFIVPRAIFHAALLISCYLAHAPRCNGRAPFDAAEVGDWYALAEAAGDNANPTYFIGNLHPSSAARNFVISCSGCLSIPGFIDGQSCQVNNVGLRCEAALLLRRCTPWGIGESLADILAGSTF